MGGGQNNRGGSSRGHGKNRSVSENSDIACIYASNTTTVIKTSKSTDSLEVKESANLSRDMQYPIPRVAHKMLSHLNLTEIKSPILFGGRLAMFLGNWKKNHLRSMGTAHCTRKEVGVVGSTNSTLFPCTYEIQLANDHIGGSGNTRYGESRGSSTAEQSFSQVPKHYFLKRTEGVAGEW